VRSLTASTAPPLHPQGNPVTLVIGKIPPLQALPLDPQQRVPVVEDAQRVDRLSWVANAAVPPLRGS